MLTHDPLMKIPVTIAGGTSQGGGGAFFSSRHELAAAVDGVLSDTGGVVLLALLVSDDSNLLGRNFPIFLNIDHFGRRRGEERKKLGS